MTPHCGIDSSEVAASPSAWAARVRRDAITLALALAAFATLAMRQQWSETLFQWLRRYEWLDLDELVLSLLMALVGCAWFACRRWLDLRRQWHVSLALQGQRDLLFQQNRELAQRLLSAQEDERRELARELHDEIAQSCTAIRFEAAYIARAIAPVPPAVPVAPQTPAQAAAQRIEQSALEVHQITRRMLQRLRPAHLDSLGFEASLQALCDAWQQQCNVRCAIDIAPLPGPLRDEAQTGLYRVVQEALTNVARHAQATQARVQLHCTNDRLTLDITDDGIGLPNTQVHSGLGRIGIRERLALLGGQAHWTSAQPGTRLNCQMPWQAVRA